MSKESLSDQAREEQEKKDLAEVAETIQRRRTVHAPKQDPYLLNLDNIGGWVLEQLVDHTTYLGTQELEEPIVGTRCIVVSGEHEDIEGIGPQHCCFIREENSTTITLRPLPGFDTFVDNSEEPIVEDMELTNGQVIHIGDGYIGFKLMDPSIAPQTARHRRAARRATTKLESPATTPAQVQSEASETPPPELADEPAVIETTTQVDSTPVAPVENTVSPTPDTAPTPSGEQGSVGSETPRSSEYDGESPTPQGTP